MLRLTTHDRMIVTFILTLKSIRGVGPKTVRDILAKNRTRILEADCLSDEFALSLDNPKIAKGLAEDGSCWTELEERADNVIESAEREGIDILHPYLREYPQRMLRNKNFPPVLFSKGATYKLNIERAVAMIGTRNPTDFGERMGRRLATILAEDGYAVVSGLAMGCDTAAHEGALDAQGTTFAVLATPLDAPVYPRANKDLAERILNHDGVLLSEYEPGIDVPDIMLPKHLVARDEWQPALADGVIAFETSVGGGSTHAMRHALATGTPLAVFDYRSRKGVDFLGDPRFGGNVEYLEKGASPIFAPDTVEAFKQEMADYRAGFRNAHWSDGPAGRAGDDPQSPQLSFGLL